MACKVALSYIFYTDLLCRINMRVGRRPSKRPSGRVLKNVARLDGSCDAAFSGSGLNAAANCFLSGAFQLKNKLNLVTGIVDSSFLDKM